LIYYRVKIFMIVSVMFLMGKSVRVMGENPMKIVVLLSFVIVGCILVAGCTGQIKPAATNTTAVTPTNTFTPLLECNRPLK